MSFLQPYFLFGLGAIAIPIIIHLFDFRRTKKVYFSNTRLLHQVKEATQSFYNLKHLLILLARILFIAALVLAFAQPFLAPQGGSILQSNRVGIYIDNSQSMSNTLGQDESGLDLAKELAREMIEIYPAGTEFLIQTSLDERSIYLYKSKQEALKYIEEIIHVSDYNSLDIIIKNFSRTNEISPSEIILISDFQKSTLMDSQLLGDTSLKILALPIIFNTYSNLAVDTAYITNPLELNKGKTNLLVRIKNTSDFEVANVPLKIFMGERQISVATVTVPAKQRVEINVNIGHDIQEQVEGRILLEDYPISFDNTLFFTLSHSAKVNIVQIMGEDSSPYVSSVYGNTGLFSNSNMLATNINYSQIPNADLIVVNQVENLEAGLALRLAAFHQDGGSLLIIPADNQSLSSYTSLIPALSLSTSTSSQVTLASPDFGRPFYVNILDNNQEQISMPTAKTVWGWGSDRNALLKFIDGRPYLSEISINLFVFASPLNESHTNFQVNALFVPIMYRIAANSQHNITPLFYRLGEQELQLTIPEIDSKDILRLTKDEMDFIPDQKFRGKNVLLALPGSSMQAGHYSVNTDEKELYSLALNINTIESDINPMTKEELSLALNGYDYSIIYGADQGEIITKITDEFKGIELWRYFLALALLFLLAEALLIRLL